MPIEKPTTQEVVEIKEIKGDVVHLKGGSLRAVIMVSGINFDLKSEDEQTLILSAYQNFLNSLDYSLEFVIHSRKLSIDEYLVMLKERETQEQNELLKTQILEYREFIKSFVETNAIMAKTFYVVVPYDSVALEMAKSSSGPFAALFGSSAKSKKGAGDSDADEGNEAIHGQLEQRVEQVANGLQRMGLRAVRLNNEELIELFYNLYNPETKERSLAIAKSIDI